MNSTTTDATLLELNEKRALNNIPVMIYVGVLSFTGLIGNLLVILVYTLALKLSSNYRIFVLFLACFDMFGCIAVMPFELFVLKNEYMFYNLTACRVFSFIKPLVILGSGFMLLVIAVERYLKCTAFGWQMTTRHATIACSLTTFAALLLSWPSPVLKGNATTNLTGGIQGVQCEIQDHLRHTIYPIVYYGLLFVCYIVATISVIVLYCLIGRKLHQHAKMKEEKFLGMQKNTENQFQLDSSTSEKKQEGEDEIETPLTRESPENNIPKSKWKVKVWDTTTKILFVITMFFLITFLPHLVLVPLLILSQAFKQSLDTIGWPIYKIFRRLFYLNQIANPFIYGFFDREFRRACYTLYEKLLCKK